MPNFAIFGKRFCLFCVGGLQKTKNRRHRMPLKHWALVGQSAQMQVFDWCVLSMTDIL